jgi:histidyl-tRNA synthetase
MPYRTNPKLLDQLQYCEDRQIPFALIIGDSELQRGVVKLRTVATREERDVPVDRLVDELRTAILSIVV